MGQYLLIPFLVGWTSINPSYFDVNYRGTRFWHTAISVSFRPEKLWTVWTLQVKMALWRIYRAWLWIWFIYYGLLWRSNIDKWFIWSTDFYQLIISPDLSWLYLNHNHDPLIIIYYNQQMIYLNFSPRNQTFPSHRRLCCSLAVGQWWNCRLAYRNHPTPEPQWWDPVGAAKLERMGDICR